jgi:hypothetical protein
MAETNYMYDSTWLFKAAGAVAASAAASIVDTGSATARVKGEIVIDVTAIEVDTGDEIYDIVLQGSPDAAFGTDTNIRDLVSLTFADATTQRTDCNQDDVIGRYVMPFTNEGPTGTFFRYLRIYTVVAGTIASGGINYGCFASVAK